MKTEKIDLWIRILLVICSIALVSVIFLPIWRIDLDAPQYPEGLQMFIYANKLGGQVDIINGLNHYIGMKTLHAEDFIEFTVLPYLIGFYALLFLIGAIVGNKKYTYVLFSLFAAFGILAMIDFWRWEYDYGHNLDPNAAIIVPGMAYQPPLIGFKQLLNFGAYSIPAAGGWIFIVVGVTMLGIISFLVIKTLKNKKITLNPVALLILIPVLFFNSCTAEIKPIKLGIDQCHYCKMTVSDARFPAEIVTTKGKVYIFDDAHCVMKFINEDKQISAVIKDIYLADYNGDHKLVSIKEVHLYKSEELRSPMGGNIASFENIDSLTKLMAGKNGTRVVWDDIIKEQ